MSPLRSRLAGAALASRNENVRRVELAWGAAISAEWAYFVALGDRIRRERLLLCAMLLGALALAGSAAAHEVVVARPARGEASVS